jgi:hypothetical protein
MIRTNVQIKNPEVVDASSVVPRHPSALIYSYNLTDPGKNTPAASWQPRHFLQEKNTTN